MLPPTPTAVRVVLAPPPPPPPPPLPPLDPRLAPPPTSTTLQSLGKRLCASWTRLGIRKYIEEVHWPTQRATLFFRAVELSLAKDGSSDSAYTAEGHDQLVLDCVNAVLTDLLDHPPSEAELGPFADQLWHLLGSHGSQVPAARMLLQALSALGGVSTTASGGEVDAPRTKTARLARLLRASSGIGPALARALVDPLCRMGGGGGGGGGGEASSPPASSPPAPARCANPDAADAADAAAMPAPRSVEAIVAAAVDMMDHERVSRKHAPGGGGWIDGLDARLHARAVCPVRGLLDACPKAASLMLLRAVVQVDARYGEMARTAAQPASASLLIRLAHVHPRYFERQDLMICLFQKLTLPRLVALCKILTPLDAVALNRLGVGEMLGEAVRTLLPVANDATTVPDSPPSTTGKRKRRSEGLCGGTGPATTGVLSASKRRALALRTEHLMSCIYHPAAIDLDKEHRSAMQTTGVVSTAMV